MAAVTAPSRGSLPWKLRLGSLAGHVARLARPARPVLANAAQIPLTIAAYGCLASAAFLFDTLVGLASAAVLLIVLEHQLADE